MGDGVVTDATAGVADGVVFAPVESAAGPPAQASAKRTGSVALALANGLIGFFLST